MKGPIVQHTAIPAACQPSLSSDAPNHTIIARFGAELCAAGHTSVPNLVRRYWSRLGATPGDYLCYETIVEFQRGATPPQVYVPLLAAALGQPTPAGERQVRQHTAHLVALGLLHVTYTGRANVYDFSPLYRRVAELSVATPLHTIPTPAPLMADTVAATAVSASPETPPEAPVRAAAPPRSDRRDSPPYEDVPTSRFDSIPPDPPSTEIVPAPTAGSDEVEVATIAALVAEIGVALDDGAPRSSRTRVEALRQAHALDAAAFAALADQARRVVERRRRKGPPLRRAMAYWFDVLTALLTDAGRAVDEEADSTDQRGLPLSSGPQAARTRGRDKEPSAAGADACPAQTSTPADPPTHQAPEDIVPVAGETSLADAGPGGELWRCVAAELATVMTPENHRQWIAPTTAELADDPTGAGNPVLRVTVSGAFHREWLERKLRCRVENTLRRVEGGVGVRVEFVVAR